MIERRQPWCSRGSIRHSIVAESALLAACFGDNVDMQISPWSPFHESDMYTRLCAFVYAFKFVMDDFLCVW